MPKPKNEQDYILCTDDTVIMRSRMTFAKALKEARSLEKTFLGLHIYICEVVADAAEV